jgi:hypothetical protein
MVGRENTFPGPFIDAVNRKGGPAGVTAGMAQLGGAAELEQPAYAVLVDRISHEVPYYRAHLKGAALMGTVVVNDPFWWEADDKFFECALARRLGVAVPRTVVLPNKEYVPDIDPGTSLRNLRFPLDWDGIVGYVGLPAVPRLLAPHLLGEVARSAGGVRRSVPGHRPRSVVGQVREPLGAAYSG